MTAYLGTLIQKRKPKGSIKGVHPCPTCQTPFNNITGKKKFCSKSCWPTTEKQCEVCTASYQSRKKSERFCSPACANSQKETDYKASMQDKNKNTGLTCMLCHQHFKTLAFHLSSAHQMTTQEYKRQYSTATVSTGTHAILSAQTSGDRNVWAKHSGKLSVFSKNFAGYTGLSEEQKQLKISQAVDQHIKSMPKENRPMSLQYWINKGFSQEEAETKLSERQSTFSLEKCIERYGEEAGLRRWQDRQEKWQNNLNSKPDEEIARINNLKMGRSSGAVSNISRALFSQIHLTDARWGSLEDGNGGEVMLSTSHKKYMLDFVSSKKCIEFNGDYWHAKPGLYTAKQNIGYVAHKARTAQEIWEMDRIKHNEIRSAGYELLVIWESDFRKNKEEVIEECKKFLST